MADKPLAWGETPWDALSRRELLRETQRLWCALSTAYSVLRLVNTGGPFWGEQGSGGRAERLAKQAMAPYRNDTLSEAMYRNFFRYAECLLFDVPAAEQWVFCDTCHEGTTGADRIGQPCFMGEMTGRTCAGRMRRIQWSDLEPATPSIADLGGSAPDFTGELSTDEYIDAVRGKQDGT